MNKFYLLLAIILCKVDYIKTFCNIKKNCLLIYKLYFKSLLSGLRIAMSENEKQKHEKRYI